MRRSLLILLILIIYLPLARSQYIQLSCVGNGYEWESATAQKAMECISYRCFDQLRRTKFVDEQTYVDERLHSYLDSLQMYVRSGWFTINRYTRYSATDIPPLTYYGTYTRKASDETFFQIQLSLAYESGGLLRADSIQLLDRDFFTALDTFAYRYNNYRNGNRTNLPFPPPPPPPPKTELIVIPLLPHLEGRVNLCNDCQRHLIRVDGQRMYWLDEQHQYQLLRRLGTERLLAKKDGKYGVITDSNEVIIPLVYDGIEAHTNGFYKVRQKEEKGVLAPDGTVVLPSQYDDVAIRQVDIDNKTMELVFIVRLNEQYGVVNRAGEWLLPMEYDQIFLSYTQLFRLEKDGKHGLAYADGTVLLKPQYDNVELKSTYVRMPSLAVITTLDSIKQQQLVVENSPAGRVVKRRRRRVKE